MDVTGAVAACSRSVKPVRAVRNATAEVIRSALLCLRVFRMLPVLFLRIIRIKMRPSIDLAHQSHFCGFHAREIIDSMMILLQGRSNAYAYHSGYLSQH